MRVIAAGALVIESTWIERVKVCDKMISEELSCM